MAMTQLPIGPVVRQRSFRVRKSLRDLINKPKTQITHRNLSLPVTSLPDDQNNETPIPQDYTHDILYECQRGSWTVGYSSKTLLQFDPNPWCDENMQYTPMDTKTYQLPDPTWQWVSKEWMVDMSGDVDEAGWQYAFKFHGAVWHGNYKHLRSFVRRRRWIRLRHRLQPTDAKRDLNYPSTQTTPSRRLIATDDGDLGATSSNDLPIQDYQVLMNNLKTCRLDRERLAMVKCALSANDMPDKILSEPHAVLNMLEYESSKRDFLKLVLEARSTYELDEDEKRAFQALSFYSDVQYLLESLGKKAS